MGLILSLSKVGKEFGAKRCPMDDHALHPLQGGLQPDEPEPVSSILWVAVEKLN